MAKYYRQCEIFFVVLWVSTLWLKYLQTPKYGQILIYTKYFLNRKQIYTYIHFAATVYEIKEIKTNESK